MSKWKSLYDSMLSSGDLLELFPNFSGIWEKDMAEFVEEYDENNLLIETLETEEQEEYEENESYL